MTNLYCNNLHTKQQHQNNEDYQLKWWMFVTVVFFIPRFGLLTFQFTP